MLATYTIHFVDFVRLFHLPQQDHYNNKAGDYTFDVVVLQHVSRVQLKNNWTDLHFFLSETHS